MKRAVLLAVWATATCMITAAGYPGKAHSAGLKTTFVKVSLENLRVGGTYNIRAMANLPLAVYNTGDAAVSIKVEPTAPIAGETREGYEPIPDAAWITFNQDAFEGVEPGRAAITDVVISIPHDRRHLGKKYQVMIWSHTVGGGMVACGLKSEVLFSISSEPDEPEKAIGLFPTEMIIPGLEPGKAFKVKEEGGGATLKVFNPFEDGRTVTVKQVPAANSTCPARDGYVECPDPGVLELVPHTVLVPAGGHQSIEVVLHVPEGGAPQGKGYVFAVGVFEAGRETPVCCSAIYINVK